MVKIAESLNALKKCPDQRPSETTKALAFVQDAVLRDSIRLDVSGATTAMHNGEWKAATVLAGSAIEAILLWAIEIAAADGRLQTIKNGPSGLPERWNLGDFIKVAEKLQIIKPSTVAQLRLAKDFRNLIHPGRSRRTAEICDRGTALTALAGIELVIRDLS